MDTVDVNTAREAIEADRVQRQQACVAEYNRLVQELQARYQCEIVPTPIITAEGRISVTVRVVAR